MCCNAHSKSDPANETTSTHVDETLVATPLPDGYWLSAFPYSVDATLPDLIGYGLGFEGKPASVKLFHNPKNAESDGWKVTEIQSLDFPVAMAHADLTGNGFNDVIICDRYGPSIHDLWDANTKNGGRLQWLRNPGDRNAQPYWEAHHIGNSTGMHRLRAGHFTTREHFQVMGLPILSRSSDVDSPAPVIIYTPVYGSDISKGPESWSEEIAFGSQFRIIHEAQLLPGSGDDLDAVLVAGREGVVLLYFNQALKKWDYNVVGTGLPKEGDNPYWGSGTVHTARVADDDVGYVAACEGLHGNTVSVYVKDSSAPKGTASLKEKVWKRIVIDNYGPLKPEDHMGTIHYVTATRVGQNEFDSFVIACMGSPVGNLKNKGVYLYTPDSLAEGRFTKTKLTDESAGYIAVAGYNNPNKQDIASISYYVPGYHTGPDPPNIRINTLDSYNTGSRTEIFATKLNKEVLLRIPNPKVVPEGYVPSMPLVTIGGKKMTLVVLRPGAVLKLGRGDGVKVIHGSITMQGPKGGPVTRGIATVAKGIATTHILSDDGSITAVEGTGAVFLRVEPLGGEFQGPYTAMSQVTTNNLFPHGSNVSASVRAMEFPFVKVETLEWASEGPNKGLWDNFEFYNMTGFHVFFNDDALEEVVHIQAWTLGLGETARFHNHDQQSFCEIHYCLSNGAGEGGMRYFADEYTDKIDQVAELTKEYVENNSARLDVPTMFEHGPLWKIQPGTKATPKLRENDTVDYPWHAWLASQFGQRKLPIIPPLSQDDQKFDLWLAFEFPSSAFQY